MKVAISIPDDVFEAGEEVSRRMGVTRSRLYADAVRAYAAAHSGDEITRRLNQVYATEANQAESPLADASLEVLRRERW